MAFNIKDPVTDRLARELASATGESLTEAVRAALRERLERETRPGRKGMAAEIRRIQERLARLPVLDKRSPDRIVGYDKHGLPR
ncbi:MAG: type II toxin-antitoxin system VapB family antitoxin [Gemmatimonadaceae bacterium]|nr:type II toxin-antitoxin system VapB family antitoxin [Gemmatimonadaceae bacterium]